LAHVFAALAPPFFHGKRHETFVDIPEFGAENSALSDQPSLGEDRRHLITQSVLL